MEQKKIEYHERVRAGYLTMLAQEPERWMLVDAMQGIEAVQTCIRETVMARLDPIVRAGP
jgi:dTMP kinase